jgi:FkbM family methyltransferase
VKTLVINTYGGSLLLGARAVGAEIIGSYEDTAFGLPIQQANFPELDFRPMRRDWPTQDLSETFVIAHPPCSAFSVQNSNPQARGVDSAAFACTKSVLDYSLRECRAAGLAVESVVGALAGAWSIHQKFADEFGYNLYRILQNGSMFGAQWRDRFWVVYLKKGTAPEVMNWQLYPRWSTVRQEVEGYLDGPAPAGLDEALDKLKRRFIEEAGCTQQDLEYIFDENPEELTSVDDRLWRRKFPTVDRWEVCKRYVTKYASGAMVHLAPRGLCPVLLGGSWWFMDGRNLSEQAYKRLMGFPSDYIFPEGDTGRKKDNYRVDMRTYLSKGVMPPVASFILENVFYHLGTVPTGHELRHCGAEGAYALEVAPNFIADFRIRKKTWGEQRPALRHEDEHGIARRVITADTSSVDISIAAPAPAPRPRVQPTATRQPMVRVPRSKSPWNAPTIEEALSETLFVRPNTADAYALHESHGYHRMGVRPGDIVLDLGSHIGCVASRAALVGAERIICVEAEPENFELLQRNTRSFPAVETIWGAVYGGTGERVTLNRPKQMGDAGRSTGTSSVCFTTRGDKVDVPRVDFRQLLEQHQPTVIKCDIEGSEFTLGWDDLPASVRSIGIEFHHRGGVYRDQAKAIVQKLYDQGFRPVNRLNMDSNFSAIIAYFSREQHGQAGNDEVHGPVGNNDERKAEGAPGDVVLQHDGQ